MNFYLIINKWQAAISQKLNLKQKLTHKNKMKIYDWKLIRVNLTEQETKYSTLSIIILFVFFSLPPFYIENV